MCDVISSNGDACYRGIAYCVRNIDFDNKPAKIYVRGQNTKTIADRTIFLTEEITNQLNAWLKYKYRTRQVCHQIIDNEENINKKIINEHRKPDIKKLILYLHQLIVIKHLILIRYIMIWQDHLLKH